VIYSTLSNDNKPDSPLCFVCRYSKRLSAALLCLSILQLPIRSALSGDTPNDYPLYRRSALISLGLLQPTVCCELLSLVKLHPIIQSTLPVDTSVKSVRSPSVLSAKIISGVTSVRRPFVLTAKILSIVKSVRRHAVVSAKIPSIVMSVISHSVLSAKILSGAKSVRRHAVVSAKILTIAKCARSPSVLIAKIVSLAINARRTSVLVAESRSLVTMKVSIRFAASSAKKCMLVVV
jgi:hypothetical protein